MGRNVGIKLAEREITAVRCGERRGEFILEEIMYLLGCEL